MSQKNGNKCSSKLNMDSKSLFPPISKKGFHAIEQWSQEENCGDDEVLSEMPWTNGNSSCRVSSKPEDVNAKVSTSDCPKNNNLIQQESNLRCSIDKCSYYKNFTLKVNNNMYPEQSTKDGMEEYFEQNSKSNGDTVNYASPSLTQPVEPNENRTLDDQINALSRDDEAEDEVDDDDDRCIYTYKGDHFESNLCHLLDTCYSCGLPTIARVSAPQSTLTAHTLPVQAAQSSPQNNLYSPEMDFLEMDFDPGSNGDGADSECEDNNVVANASTQNQLQQKLKANQSTLENIVTPLALPLCQQCELCASNDKKLNNISDSEVCNVDNDHCTNKQQSPINILDKNVPAECAPASMNQNIHFDKSHVSMEDKCKMAENNLNADGGDDADDERDDSIHEKAAPTCTERRSSCSSFFYPVGGPQMPSDAAHEPVTCPPSSAAPPPHNHTEQNNNLGCVSAPEVSPTKEFSLLDILSRSMSFHNQLSSPKYENVCFNRLKATNKGRTSADCAANCTGSDVCGACAFKAEANNIEACTDRLNQRVKSVFNIGSPPSSEQQDHDSNNTLINIPVDDVLCNNWSCLPVKVIQSKDDSSSSSAPANRVDASRDSLCKETAEIKKVMIWTEPQAAFRQVIQVATSACGPTAVMNVLLALDQACAVAAVREAIPTRLRADQGTLVEYLFSRCNAGTTHQDLMRGVAQLSRSAVTSTFFHMYPKRSFQLTRWLAYWIEKGGVPVATLNLQVGVHAQQTVPDAWHHQMVFGVGPRGVYLTNPLECVSDSLLSEQLCSDSVLLVRRADLIQRSSQNDQLIQLSLHQDPSWNEMNVLGQVVGILKEHTTSQLYQGRHHVTSHVAIPASYQSGMTIFMRSDNPHKEALLRAPQLPLLHEHH